MIEIFTDGSAIKGRLGGFGVAVYSDGKLIETHSERFEDTTNNRMEISAILWALKNYGADREDIDNIPVVYSDSQYCVNTFNNWMFSWVWNDWIKSDGKEPLNLDLIQEYYNLWNKDKRRIKLEWVKGHANNEGNILADKLATTL